jgi:inosine-uridine nucleoside N-ribohydrolase
VTKRKIIIDCDPGQDDAVALFLALSSPDELEVLGITTVAGNVPLDLTQRNAPISGFMRAASGRSFLIRSPQNTFTAKRALTG